MDPKTMFSGLDLDTEGEIEDIDFTEILSEQEEIKERVLELEKKYLAQYKQYVEEGFGIRPLVVLINAEGAEYDYLYPVFGDDPERKHEAYKMVDKHARDTQAQAMISVSEARWIPKEDDTGERPSTQESAQPCVMILCFAHGWTHMTIQLFERTDDGIEWGEKKNQENINTDIPIDTFRKES